MSCFPRELDNLESSNQTNLDRTYSIAPHPIRRLCNDSIPSTPSILSSAMLPAPGTHCRADPIHRSISDPAIELRSCRHRRKTVEELHPSDCCSELSSGRPH